MVFGERVYPVRSVAIRAEFFRSFFLHSKKTAVVIVVGQGGRCFFGCLEEEGQDCHGSNNKGDIYEEVTLLFFCTHGGFWKV